MAQPYVGEIRIFAGNFAPNGWLICDGSLLPISENETLFQLIGTTYGGDGQSTFGLPDLQGRLPVHAGNGYVLGETGGTESVSLTVAQLPAHSHVLSCNNNNGTSTDPANNFWAAQPALLPYLPPLDVNGNTNINAPMKAGAINSVGGSQPHDNMHPFIALNFIISLFGIFPSPS